jgi:hypothetical protein
VVFLALFTHYLHENALILHTFTLYSRVDFSQPKTIFFGRLQSTLPAKILIRKQTILSSQIKYQRIVRMNLTYILILAMKVLHIV